MNILIVDDDKVDRLVVRELLGSDIDVFEATSADSAQACLESNQIDCVLLDFLIPGTDSLALLGELAARQLPVIMLTGEGNEHIAVNAMKQGAQDYISKRNLSSEFLKKTIANAVETVGLRQKLNEKQRELVFANDELRHKVAELEAVNNDLESFLHIAAHDLREPINKLCSYCDLIEQEPGLELSTDVKNYLASIQRSARKLASLIDSLRALTEVVHAPLDQEAVNIAQVVEDVLGDFEGEREHRKVQVKSDHLPTVLGLRQLMVELFRNLIGNAFKYGDLNNLQIEITMQKNGDAVIFGVKNNGNSIPTEEITKVFQPCYRLSNSKGKDGTGMGLTLCQKIIERHGGKIWIENSVPSGVHVKFTLGKQQLYSARS